MQFLQNIIKCGKASIGIEFGSTRIKSVLIDNTGNILASGGFDWENHFIDGIWTYTQNEIIQGLQESYRALSESVKRKYHITLRHAAAIGISAMMHGYMPFDKNNYLLVPFRTWRNNITAESSEKLTALFRCNIPQRWSIAHLYQAILNQEPHIAEIHFMTTLAGYIHWRLTGQKVLGIGEASGMFPIDTETGDFNQTMLKKFERLISPEKLPWKISEILPDVLFAGQNAGALTAEGALLLDPTGNLQAGIPLCPPEGDAGTGMVATNSIKPRTGNISAGTSAFAMVVLEKPLTKTHTLLDSVTTPDGKSVAMAHSNNCTTDINAWVNLFGECLQSFGVDIQPDQLYETLFMKSLEASHDCGNLLAYGFYSGEHGLGLNEGYPMLLHSARSQFNLANLMRVHLYGAFAAMKAGMDILLKQEQVKIDRLLAHGGIFKTQNVAQQILASAINVPIAVMDTANEGGAWGIALLANYLHAASQGISLEDYLDDTIFKQACVTVSEPEQEMVRGYEKFIAAYMRGISVVRQAINTLN